MSAAAKKASPQATSLQITQLSGDIEMGCLNLQIMLDSIIDRLDGLGDDIGEAPSTHAHFNAINCFTMCATQMVKDVLENSLAMASAAREAS